MAGPERLSPQRLAQRAFWGLAGLGLLVLASLALGFAVWGLTPPEAYGLCASLLGALPPLLRLAAGGGALFLAASLGLGLGCLLQQLAAARRLVRQLKACAAGAQADAVAGLLAETGLAGRVEVVDDPRLLAFSYGAWRPRVLLSAHVVRMLEREELRAVLLHEAHHVRCRDAAKAAAARALARALFFLPAARDLAEAYLLLKELAADAFAIRTMGDPWPLASALAKLARHPHLPGAGSAAARIAGPGPRAMALRVRQLLDYPRPVQVPLAGSPLRLALSAAVLAASVALAAWMAHPAYAPHAAHHTAWCSL